MLTEQFIASIGGLPTKAPGTSIAKDAAIFVYENQPLLAQKSILKKSATPPNCLAVSESHIFAAQAEKAVVHVYNREKGNQEATVPFPERITCLTLACDDTVLVLGTAEGRIFLWEVCSGRQLTTAQSHLQSITVLAVDPTSNFLLSVSADSTVQVWSIPSLVDFSNSDSQTLSPLQTFSSHRTSVKALALGHSSTLSNIAVSAAEDQTCLVWDYHSNHVLRTYLLPAIPTCIAMDSADRAAYLGYDDGSVQQIDFFATTAGQKVQLVAPQAGKDALTPIQPGNARLWTPPDSSSGSVLSLDVSFDGSILLSGHQSGAILAWDVATGHVRSLLAQGPLPGPASNLQFLPVSGFRNEKQRRLKVDTIVKPKFGAFSEGNGRVPGNYTLGLQLLGSVPDSTGLKRESTFKSALTAPTFPSQLLEEGLGELATWQQKPLSQTNGVSQEQDDFMSFDEEPDKSGQSTTMEQQNAELKAQLEALRRVQKVSFEKMEEMNNERKRLLLNERRRIARQDGDPMPTALSSDESESD